MALAESYPGGHQRPPAPASRAHPAPGISPEAGTRPDPALSPDPALRLVRQAPERELLCAILLRRGAIRPADLVRALALQSEQHGRLGTILRAHGMARDADIIAALAEQYGTSVIDPAVSRPDPRLIDRFGPRRCLQLGLLPWVRAGAFTLVACTHPETFAQHRAELESALGPVAMAVIRETDLHSALIGSRRNTLRLMAETCVAARESCRSWDAQRYSRMLLAALVVLVTAMIYAPMAAFLTLFGVVVVSLVLGTALKLAAAIAELLPSPPPLPDPGAGTVPFRARKPCVSVMVPMLREPDIAPRLLRRLSALTYPRELLDIMLVVEEDDHLTRDALAAAALPHWMRVIPVPDSDLRTKPRALNYALNYARGSIVGVWDAEDAPAFDQIHRVVERFAAAGPDLACLQGILDYYNPRTNWLSRCFTIEYAAWFRLMLPGLQKLGLVVPLGGTTLFFRREILESLGGWDAHNVTEDADLGLRLARHGYRTELLDTVTLEEANCRLWPWVKQRSRWLKGYAMTYAVHMRDPALLWRQLGAWRFAGVQVLFLGTLIQFLLAPMLWSFWLLLFGFGHPLAAALPGWAAVGVASLFLLAEITSIGINMIAVRGRRHRFLRPWTLTLQLYFPLAALAAYKGCWEMVASPFYWDKTTHGLHDTAPQRPHRTPP